MNLFKRISSAWKMLNRSIYTGSRLKENLAALSFAGAFFAIVGLILFIANLIGGNHTMVFASAMTALFGAGCTYFASVLKRRDLAILMPTIFSAIAFTVYALTGAGEGSAILWTFTVPIGICYFVSVKYGILLSLYYMIIFLFIFYTPLGKQTAAFYSEGFIQRFPLIYACTAVLTAAAMAQYHRGVLLENEYTDKLNNEVRKQTRVATERADKLAALSEEMVETLAVAIDAKDRYTNGHSFRVSWYSAALAKSLGWPEEQVNELEHEALLHDIGKIGIPDSILNKPTRLTDEEFTVIKSHTTTGGNILSRSEDLLHASEVARYHHERYDGKGYPEGLAGTDIPLHARIVAIADAYDAMRSDRIYRKGLSLERIREELIVGKGKQFDPELLDVFLNLSDSGELDEIAHRHLIQESFETKL